MLKKFNIKTETSTMLNITKSVLDAIAESGVSDGICVVSCPHTSAGVTITEQLDSCVVKDVMYALGKMFFQRPEFEHNAGDTPAHLKSIFVGNSVDLIIENGKPLLGMWQGIYFCEFDAPRSRSYFVKIIEG